MLTIEQVRRALGDRNLKQVAERAGLHYNTVRAIARGENENPSYETMRALARYIEDTSPFGAGDGRE